MASSIGDSETKSYEIAVIQAAGLERLQFKRKSMRAYVQIDAAGNPWRTKDVTWKNGVDLRWDDKFTLLPLSSSAKITFSLFRDGRFKLSKKLVGKLEIELGELLEQCAHRPGEDISLSLEGKGKQTCKLTVRVKDPSTTAFTSAVEHLPEPNENTTAPRLTAAADAITSAAKAIPSATDALTTAGNVVTSVVPPDLLGSFASLMKNLSIVVKLGDEIAKIHPWVHLAWNVLSVGLKLVQAQKERDDKIAQLVETMRSTYAIVAESEKLKGDLLLQDVVDLILKQTVICGYFIQGYTRRGSFAGKALTETFSNTDNLISRYQDTFKQLRENFMGRIATHTALITADVAATVNEIRSDQLLDKLKPAIMDEFKRGVCLPNTRLGAIKSVTDWFSDSTDGGESVMWVYGLAGAGKSTLATTIARMMDDVGLLGASFFFDRGITERNSSTLIPTLAHQLAHFDAAIAAKVQQVIRDTPNIANQPLAVQFSKLLSAAALGDIPWSRGPVLVVIDALDEAGSVADRKDLMQALSGGLLKLPSFIRILIVSRPERDMLDQFEDIRMRREELKVDSKTSQADITVFIRSQLHEIRKANIKYLPALQDWPSDEDIVCLVILAAGHFIWAATACRLIDEGQDPKESMGELVKYQPGAHANPFAGLHQLYQTALKSAGKWSNEAFCSDFRTILGAVIAARVPLSCTTIDTLLGLSRPSVQTISRLGSVLRGGEDEPIQLLHTSFFDYLTLPDPKESWTINVGHSNEHMARGCIIHLEQKLKENMCNLTLPHPIKDEKLPESVEYASRFWIEHVCLITDTVEAQDLCPVILAFMEIHLLHWIEALAIMKSHHVAIRSLTMFLKWIQKHLPAGQLYLFVNDAHRFAQYFSNTIEEHPLLIYATALPFTPHDTLIYKTFHHDRLARVVSGIEPTWPPLLQVMHGHDEAIFSVGFSPDGLKIVSGSDDKTIRVWDALTGNQLLSPLQGHDHAISSVGFSPDGLKIVSGSWDKTIRVWDALTGNQLLSPLQGHDEAILIVSGSEDETIRVWDALTGNQLLSPLQGHDDAISSAGSMEDRKDLMQALSGGFLKLPSFIRILIVSRPERDMMDQFRHIDMRREELRVDSEASQADITVFIRSRLHEIRQGNIEYVPALQDWPSEEDITCLVILAAGLFIWAATACRLIDEGQDPKESMDELVKYQPGAHANPFAGLHQLYHTALESAGRWGNEAFCSDFRTILGAVIAARVPLSCTIIDTLLGLSQPSVQMISHFGSVLRGGMEEPIQLLHTSFSDYLTLPDLDEPWAINVGHSNEQMARRCITHLEEKLKENMCNLTLPNPIQDEKLPESVVYACRFWIEHVCLITDTAGAEGLGPVILAFVKKHLLHWIEALAIMKSHHVAIRSLSMVLKWIQKYVPAGQLYRFVNDAHRFAQYFSNTIEEHPLLIYATALPFTPRDTLIYKTFYHDRPALVVSGVELTWPPLLQVMHGHDGAVSSIAFSPDGLNIVSGSDDKTIR
ncbi:WD40 repeat-like protein, partial [Athelia psychrophila]